MPRFAYLRSQGERLQPAAPCNKGGSAQPGRCAVTEHGRAGRHRQVAL